MPVFKYAIRTKDEAGNKGKWSEGKIIDSVEWSTEEEALRGLEAQFPGRDIYVKMTNEKPAIKAETKKSTKEVGNAGIKAMKERLGK